MRRQDASLFCICILYWFNTVICKNESVQYSTICIDKYGFRCYNKTRLWQQKCHESYAEWCRRKTAKVTHPPLQCPSGNPSAHCGFPIVPKSGALHKRKTDEGIKNGEIFAFMRAYWCRNAFLALRALFVCTKSPE